ncbi:MATE family efflux transporter [Nonlabens marinus]|uniref:Polysaccharide biosynthesis protein n=1 Tax=Nonlabens marinus S1-08 TaxID=1454201 RepID=W8VWM0_9FLAO|nr:polysaccharide biosynthesis C-terminal domain-containing protein [Nonlabens marinus]BAO54857.1 polysaccharide biosynthesis protein [Nonlabens marinus S1-08]
MSKYDRAYNSIVPIVQGLFNRESKIWLLFWRTAGAAMFFILTIIMTNSLSKEVFGAFEYGRSSLMLLGSIILFGTDRSILQFFGRLESQKSGGDIFLVYRKMVLMVFSFCTVLLVIYFIVPESIWIKAFADYEGYLIILKVVLFVFFYSITVLNTEYFRVLNKMVLSELFRGVFKYSPLAVIVLYIMITQNYQYLFELYLLGFVVLSVITTALVLWLKHPLSRKAKISTNEILKKSYPMAISGLGFMLLTTIDIYFLKQYTGLEQIAIYAVPVKITMLLAMVITTFQAAVSTEISTLFYKKEMDVLQMRLRRITNIIFLITLPLLIGTYLFGDILLGFFGSSFTEGKTALDILLIGFLFSTFSSLSPSYLNMTGREKVLQVIILITVLINLILNLILIPSYGIVGAAAASSLSMAFWTVVSLIYSYKKDRIKLFVHF